MTSTVTAAAVSKNFGAYQDAAVREPVIITKNGRPRTVLLAYEDYLRRCHVVGNLTGGG